MDGMSVGFEQGKITGLIGPNGSGKSTLINTLTGMVDMDGGSIVVSGNVELQHISPKEVPAYGMIRTFQDARLLTQMTVLDNLLVVLTERGVFDSLFESHKDYHYKQARDLLEKVDLAGKEKELAENLSYGQRKLLGIARAMAMDGDVYFFDEPFSGLFPEMVKIVSRVLQELCDEGKAVVLVEHNMELIRQLSDHVIVMDSGCLLAEGEPDEVLERDEVIEAYLGK